MNKYYIVERHVSNDDGTFYIDYVGVKHWIEGTWKPKETYIKKIKEVCLTTMACMPPHCLQIEHVKGHSGNHGNDKADALAKDHKDHSNFDELLAILNL